MADWNQTIRSILKVEWSEFEALAALRCTTGVRDETDLIVDSIETIAELLAKDARNYLPEHASAT